VLIAGKGHETYQEFEDTVVPFDDSVHAREAVEAAIGRAVNLTDKFTVGDLGGMQIANEKFKFQIAKAPSLPAGPPCANVLANFAVEDAAPSRPS
jgi:hypothetical protein